MVSVGTSRLWSAKVKEFVWRFKTFFHGVHELLLFPCTILSGSRCLLILVYLLALLHFCINHFTKKSVVGSFCLCKHIGILCLIKESASYWGEYILIPAKPRRTFWLKSPSWMQEVHAHCCFCEKFQEVCYKCWQYYDFLDVALQYKYLRSILHPWINSPNV